MVVPYDLAEEGGVKRHAMQLAATLRGLGDEVDVIGPYSGRGPGLPEHTYGFSGVINIPANGSDNYLGIFVQPWKVWRHMRRKKYDVLHVHEPLQPSINYYALWTVGRQAARDPRLVFDLRDGRQPGERVRRRIEHFMNIYLGGGR